MTELSEQDELKLDKEKAIVLDRGELSFLIGPEDVLVYGEVDLTTNSKDYKQIDKLRVYDRTAGLGITIPAHYDYERHAGVKRIGSRYVQWFDTISLAKAAQYAHGFLNKPKRIVIFKKTVKAKYDKLNRCYND